MRFQGDYLVNYPAPVLRMKVGVLLSLKCWEVARAFVDVYVSETTNLL